MAKDWLLTGQRLVELARSTAGRSLLLEVAE